MSGTDASDPNADRKAYLEAELKEAIGYLVKSTVAAEEAKRRAEYDASRVERLSKELKGIAALEAREDAWYAANGG